MPCLDPLLMLNLIVDLDLHAITSITMCFYVWWFCSRDGSVLSPPNCTLLVTNKLLAIVFSTNVNINIK